MKGRVLLWCVLALAVCTTPWAGEPAAAAAPVAPDPQVFYMGTSTAEHADVSPPLRDMPPVPRRGKKTDKDDPGPLTPCGPIDGYDPVAQTSVGAPGQEAPAAMPAPNVSFDAFVND